MPTIIPRTLNGKTTNQLANFRLRISGRTVEQIVTLRLSYIKSKEDDQEATSHLILNNRKTAPRTVMSRSYSINSMIGLTATFRFNSKNNQRGAGVSPDLMAA
jgi:hypothetical protein